MSKVVISGFYGFHNIGDEAILKTLIQQLKKMNPSTEIVVLSHTPKETAALYGVKAIKRNDLLSVFLAIKQCDVLLSGGGSLLQDDTSARSIHYYLSILRMGIWLKKRVYLISNGIGPLIREKNKKRVASVLNRVEHITVRDFNSEKLLVDIGVQPEKISVSADMVIGMEMEPQATGKRLIEKLQLIHPERKKIAIAIRHKDFKQAEKLDQLVNLANQLSKTYSVIFVPFYYDDDMTIHVELSPKTYENVYFINQRYSAEEVLSLLQNMDILMGSRLHSLIFSLVAQVPFIGISYDPKIENFMEMIDMQPVCSMKDFDALGLLDSVRALDESYDAALQHVILSKKQLKERLKVNEHMLEKVL